MSDKVETAGGHNLQYEPTPVEKNLKEILLLMKNGIVLLEEVVEHMRAKERGYYK